MIAGLTDALDGPLARRAEPTRAGRDLEGLVDACFTAAALRGARRQDLIARWAVAAESLRIGSGTAYGLATYFLYTTPPDGGVIRAARRLSPLRTCGLLLATTGRRRTGTTLLGTGALASVGLGLAPILWRAHERRSGDRQFGALGFERASLSSAADVTQPRSDEDA